MMSSGLAVSMNAVANDETPVNCGSNEQPVKYRDDNKQLSTQSDVIMNGHENFPSIEGSTSHYKKHNPATKHKCHVCAKNFQGKEI